MTGSRPKILLAEDDPVAGEIVRFNCELAGYDTIRAWNGRDALIRLAEGGFDLLITDCQMPELDGEGLCKAVREELQNWELPILFCTAKGLEIDTVRLKAEWGVVKVFHKPFSMREVLTSIADVLSASPVPAPACAPTGG
jgi:two-component system response regulator VicR